MKFNATWRDRWIEWGSLWVSVSISLPHIIILPTINNCHCGDCLINNIHGCFFSMLLPSSQYICRGFLRIFLSSRDQREKRCLFFRNHQGPFPSSNLNIFTPNYQRSWSWENFWREIWVRNYHDCRKSSAQETFHPLININRLLLKFLLIVGKKG